VHEHIRSVVAALGRPEWAALPDHGERVQRLELNLPAAVWHRVQVAVTTKYRNLEGRYGRPTAVAIVSAGILGMAIPVPGTSIVAVATLIGLAELHHRLSTMTEPSAGLIAQVRLAESEIRALGQHWIEDLAKLIEPGHDVQETG
jgi:hypothetical protein